MCANLSFSFFHQRKVKSAKYEKQIAGKRCFLGPGNKTRGSYSRLICVLSRRKTEIQTQKKNNINCISERDERILVLVNSYFKKNWTA